LHWNNKTDHLLLESYKYNIFPVTRKKITEIF
jgi:hypothetical protein